MFSGVSKEIGDIKWVKGLHSSQIGTFDNTTPYPVGI